VSPVADCDNSGAVTLTDYAYFTEFLAGPVAGSAGGCHCFDVDDSRTIDLRDFAAMQVAFGARRVRLAKRPTVGDREILARTRCHGHLRGKGSYRDRPRATTDELVRNHTGSTA